MEINITCRDVEFWFEFVLDWYRYMVDQLTGFCKKYLRSSRGVKVTMRGYSSKELGNLLKISKKGNVEFRWIIIIIIIVGKSEPRPSSWKTDDHCSVQLAFTIPTISWNESGWLIIHLCVNIFFFFSLYHHECD